MIKSYNEMIKLETFEDRYEYLRLKGRVGDETFGSYRHLNQTLYKSQRWLDTRDAVIIRDGACDLGVDGFEIYDKILVHHINPITVDDLLDNSDCIYDLNNLVCTRFETHNALHYNAPCPEYKPIERKPNDTIPWR